MAVIFDIKNLDTITPSIQASIAEVITNKNLLIPTLDYIETNGLYSKKKRYEDIKDVFNKTDSSILHTNSTLCEIICFYAVKKIADELKYKILYKLGGTGFPDIDVISPKGNKYGFEVKRVSSDATLGNSATQPAENYKEIYAISFFEDSGVPHISRYEDIIVDLEVDHNPRFRLKIPKANDKRFSDIYEGSLTKYYSLENKERTKIVTRYLREKFKDDKEKWFLGNETDIVVEFLSQLKTDDYDGKEIKTFIFSRFPEMFSWKDYHKLRKVLIEEYLFLGSAKDIFTAGGKDLKGYPKIFQHFIELLPEINSRLTREGADKAEWKRKVKLSINATTRNKLNSAHKNELFKLIEEHIK